MKKAIAILLICISPGIFVIAKKVAEFQDNFKSPAVILDKNHVCIWDQPLSKICIYYRKDFKKIAEFGKRGGGPGEFIGISKVSIDADKIYISSYPKLCIFDKRGKLIKEIKEISNIGSFIPFGNNFVGTSYPYSKPEAEKSKILFSLVDSNLKKKKDIFMVETKSFVRYVHPKEVFLWIRDCTKDIVYKDKLYIGVTEKGFYLAVFDLKGNMLYEIKRKYEKRKVTEEDKEFIINETRSSWGESRWREFKAQADYTFPDYYPAYTNFNVDNDRIYVFLFQGRTRQEIIILDPRGKLLKQTSIPVLKYSYIIEMGRYAINNGKLYYMIDNEDNENWELHEVGIDR